MKARIDLNAYIVFEVQDSLFATPLLGVREIIEQQAVESIPYSKPYYLGLTNLRGAVVSVIDLRKKLRMIEKANPEPATNSTGGLTEIDAFKGFFLIVDLKQSLIGVRVDRVHSVRHLETSEITERPMIDKELVDPEFLIGASRFNDRVVTVIDLGRLLIEDELQFRQERGKAA